MSTPSAPFSQSSWMQLDPWEKAAQWRVAAPEISEEIMRLARQQAEHQMRQEVAAAEHERLMQAKQQELDVQRQGHIEVMDKKLHTLQLVGVIGGLLCIAGLIASSVFVALTGNVVPGLGIAGLGTALIGGVYGVSRSIGKQQSQLPASAEDKPVKKKAK